MKPLLIDNIDAREVVAAARKRGWIRDGLPYIPPETGTEFTGVVAEKLVVAAMDRKPNKADIERIKQEWAEAEKQ